ncbi:MAG: glycosyltransferase family 4 protein [Candidatus Aminicenantia bacterium]
MNILVISPFVPFLQDNGFKIRLISFLYALKGKNVYLVCFYEKEGEKDLSGGEDLVKEIYFFRRKNISKLQKLLNHFSLKPLLSKRFFRKDASEIVRRVINKNKIEVVIVESLLMAEYVRGLRNVYKILDEHNIEFIRAKRRFENTRNILKKIYYFLIYLRLKRYELKVIKNFEACLVCSEVDRKLVKRYLDVEPIVIPNTIDINYFYPKRRGVSTKTIVFLGTLWYEPNFDAVKFFLKEIFPIIKKRVADAKFLVIGEGSRKDFDFECYETKDVIFSGYVDDVRDYLSEARVFVAPLRMGSGTRFKILVAMAMGLPVVSTSIGCEGLDVEDGVNILIADRSEDFANKVIELIENEELRKSISSNGRSLVESKYSNDIVKEKLRNILKNLNFRE